LILMVITRCDCWCDGIPPNIYTIVVMLLQFIRFYLLDDVFLLLGTELAWRLPYSMVVGFNWWWNYAVPGTVLSYRFKNGLNASKELLLVENQTSLLVLIWKMANALIQSKRPKIKISLLIVSNRFLHQ
jgi:hypothetical protein